MDDNKRKLYDALSQDYDLGTYEQFESDIADAGKRRKLYDATIEEYDFGDFAEFENQLGFAPQAQNPVNASRSSEVDPEGQKGEMKIDERLTIGYDAGVLDGPRVYKKVSDNPATLRPSVAAKMSEEQREAELKKLTREQKLYYLNSLEENKKFPYPSDASEEDLDSINMLKYNRLNRASMPDSERMQALLEEYRAELNRPGTEDRRREIGLSPQLIHLQDREKSISRQLKYGEITPEQAASERRKLYYQYAASMRGGEEKSFWEELADVPNELAKIVTTPTYIALGAAGTGVELLTGYEGIREAAEQGLERIDKSEKFIQDSWDELTKEAEQFGSDVAQSFEEVGAGVVNLVGYTGGLLGADSFQESVTKMTDRWLANNNPDKGFIASLIPSVSGALLTIGAGLVGGPGAATAVGNVWFGTQVASSAGNTMREAEKYGATEGEMWATGLLNAGVEYFTEKIPLKRLSSKVPGKFGSAVGKVDDVTLDAEVKKLREVIQGAKGVNWKEIGATALEEGGTEAVAGIAQTAIEMIYKNPEDYPGLKRYLDAAGESALGGALVGSVTGRTQDAAQRRADNKRRKAAGKVIFAMGKDEKGNPVAGELIGKDEKGNTIMEVSGKYITVTEVGKGITMTYEQFKKAELDDMLGGRYEEGYSQNPELINGNTIALAGKAVNDAKAGVRAALNLSDDADVDAMIADKEFEGDAKEAVDTYLAEKARYEGMQDRLNEEKEDEIAEADKSVDVVMHEDGNVYMTTLPSTGEAIFITGGKVVLDEEGYIDVNQSEGLVALMPDGTKKPVRVDELREKVEVSNAEELKAAKREEIRQEVAAENGYIEQQKREKGLLFNLRDEAGDHTIEVLKEGTESSDILFDDEIMEIPNDLLMQFRKEAGVTQVKSGKVKGENEVQSVESTVPTAEEVADAQAFADAYAANTLEAYQNYLDNHPEGVYRDGARNGMWTLEGTDVADVASITNARDVLERAEANEVQPVVAPVVEGQKGENVVESSLTGEVVAPVVEAPKTALEQIPKNEKNVPLYEQVDSELAWDGVVEEAGGNEETAMIAVNSMVADKQDALKKAEKAKAKAGMTIAEKIAAENERVANIEKAKADLAKWQEIASVKAKRALAAEAESKRVADEAAARQRAEEERLRAEREAAERAEREALNGVPDMVDDKPQDARARGYRRVNGHKVDRQEPVQGLMGKEIAVKFSDSSIPTGRIAVIEAEQLQPSHIQGQRNPLHFIDEAQPKERNDAASVLSARKIAENVRPEEITSSVTAYTGAPTVNTRGEAVQGNNRSAALRLMWENNPEQAAKYKQYLMDHAAEFGLNAEEIAAMKSPVLVNMLDVSDADAITLGQYVAQDTESGGTERIKPKNVMQKMGGDMRSFANKLLASNNEEASFAELVDANGVEVLKWMAQKGYITPTQYKSAFDSKGNLTAEVKNDLRDVMYQSIFKGGSTQLEEMFNALPAKAQKAILATAFRDYDSPSGERMNGEVQNSIRAYYALARDAAFANAKNYKEAKEAAMMWARQYQLDDVSGESFLPSENFSNFAIELAVKFKGETQKTLQNLFNNIYDLIQGTKQASIFEEADNTPRTLKEAIKETFNIDYNGQYDSNSLAGGNKAGQPGRQGTAGSAATGERIEGGERPADSTGGARGNGEVSSPEIPNGSTGDVVSPVEGTAEGGNAPGQSGVAATLIKGAKWENTGEPDKIKSSRKKGDSHDITWYIGKKKYGSTTAERDLLVILAEDYGGDLNAVWNAYEQGEVLLSANEAAILKKLIETNTSAAELQQGVLELDRENPAFERATENVRKKLEATGVKVELKTAEELEEELKAETEIVNEDKTKLSEIAAKVEKQLEELRSISEEQTLISETDNPTSSLAQEIGQPSPQSGGNVVAPTDAKVNKKLKSSKDLTIKMIGFLDKIKRGEVSAEKFPAQLVEHLGVSKQAEGSEYIHFISQDGEKITLRLSDHHGNARNIIIRGVRTDKGVSIVISLPEVDLKKFKTNKWAKVDEYVYELPNNEQLYNIGKSIFNLFNSGEYVDLANAKEHLRSPKVTALNKDGVTYGWAVNGEIYLTPEGLNPNTPIHEYTHLWAAALQKSNPKLWGEVVEAMKLSPAWNEVMADENYTDIHGDDNRVASEVLSRLSGNEGYRRYMEQAEKEIAAERDIVGKVQKKGILNRIKNAVSRFWNWLKGKLGSKAKAGDGTEAKTEPWDVFVNKTLKDFDEGVNPDAKDSPLDRMFIGKKGAANLDKAEEATTRLDNLNVAREMETAGKDAKAIKLATGWERGADGKWRYETEDAKVNRAAKLYNLETRESFPISRSIEIGRVDDNSTIRLTDLVKDDELFKAYPEMEEYFVSFEKMDAGTEGSHSFEEKMIRINKDDIHSLESTLVHEIQHAIQSIEGFAKGGSTSSSNGLIQEVLKTLHVDSENAAPSLSEVIGAIENGYITRSQHEELVKIAQSHGYDDMVEYVRSLSPYSYYRRLAGEVESRNVQERLGMSPEERRNKLAEETEDVRREDQIFLEDALKSVMEGQTMFRRVVDRDGNPIGDGSWHMNYKVDEVALSYPNISYKVDESASTESVYVTYTNNDPKYPENERPKVTVRYSNHDSNAVKFGDQLRGEAVERNNGELLYRLGLKEREWIPAPSVPTQTVSKKDLENGTYEESGLTERDIMLLPVGADIAEHKGKLIKGTNKLILVDKVLANNNRGYYRYSDIPEVEQQRAKQLVREIVEPFAKEKREEQEGETLFSKKELTPEQKKESAEKSAVKNNANFVSTYKTEDGKDINYTSERAEGYGVQGYGTGNSYDGAGNSILQRQTDTGVPGANSGLNEDKGEFCVVERVFTENGAFNFTSGEKIESADDVAYIFSALEDAAKEHSFVVYVKDGKPTVIELGMGSFNATMIDIPTASLAYSRISPDHVYFVHNHPSGNLICSDQDVAMLRVFEDMSDVPVTGVIINLKTGKYGTFDTERHSVIGEKRVPENEERLIVHTLDKQIFAPDYDPMAQPLVRSSQDVAQFLNSQRMGDRPKVSFLILSRANRIIGNIHTPFTDITTDTEAVARYINERIIQFGGENAILYGDFAISMDESRGFRLLQGAMGRFGKTKLLDVVHVEGNFTKSAIDLGLLYEPETEYNVAKENEERYNSPEQDIPVESVQTQPMTFAEKITNSVLEASAKNKENLALRSDALRMFGQELKDILKRMMSTQRWYDDLPQEQKMAVGKELWEVRKGVAATQRTYDKSTVDQLVKLAKMYFKDAQLLGGLTPYQVGRVMTRLNNAVGKRDITDDANELVNILVDAHNKELDKMLEKQAKTKAKKVNASGVEVIGKLDKEGQLLLEEYNNSKVLDLETIDEKILDLQNEAAEASGNVEGESGEQDAERTREVAARLRGLELARQYREEILAKLTEIKGLEQELKSAEQDAKDGAMDRAAYKEFRRATERAILESKLEMVDAYHGLIHGLGGEISTAGRRAKLFQQAQIDHVKEIQHNANSDLLGHPAEAQGETPDKWNSSVPRLFMSAMPTFQTMLKFFGEKAADGRGYLYERFIPQHTQASHNEYIGKTEAREKMRKKLTEIFGKKTSIEDFLDMSRKDGAVLEYQEGGEKKTIDLTRGQVLYLYMINKMADGQMKLSRMGITDADVQKMANELPEEFVRFADWVQEDFLTELRDKYNAVHERMFGAPMAAIESYFPIKINKRSRGEKIEPGMNAEDKPSTVTGSVIKRTKNAVAIDLSADAMQVLLGHIDDMENWAAWAEFRRDVKSLLNYRHFQNQVKGMESLRYGSGEKLWKNFVDVANIAAGSFKPSSTAADRAVRNIAKGVVSSKIAFRYFTALKQILSTPAFWSEVDFGKMMNAYLHQKEAWDWAMKNLPGFSKRWEGRASGNEILLESDADWKVWQNRAVQWLSKEGMRANAFIDALTVATGAKAVFETKYEMFKKAGYSEERAREKALNRAAEAYNESQQSSESAYLSPLQAEATFVSSVLTAYRNSPFGYNRKMATAIANLKKKMKKGFKQESIEYMTKQLMRDGLNEEQAKEYAKSTYRRSVARDAADVALYEFFLNYIWVLGPSLIYILGGDDDEKKKDLNVEALIDGVMGGLGNLPAGETLTGAIKAIAEGDVSNFKLPQAVAMQDMETIADLMQTDPVRAAGEVLNILVAMGVGVNPQTFTDMFVALSDVDDFNPRELTMLMLRLINAPNSKLELLEADEAMENYGANMEEVMKEYAEYQKSKRAPLSGWLYSDESEQKAMERYEKRFKKILDERLEAVVENTAEYDAWYENSDPLMRAKLSKLRKAYLEGGKKVTFEKLEAEELVKKTLYGAGYDDINTVYYELSNAQDEDMELMIDEKLKELKPVYEEHKTKGKEFYELHKREIDLYGELMGWKNAANGSKRAMKDDPERAQRYMNEIREYRTKAIDLINNYNE